MMHRQIKFIAASKEAELVVPRPQPAKNYIPEWYKKIPTTPSKLEFSEPGIASNISMKGCMPFLDSYRQGYIMSTWTDIYISSNNGQDVSEYNWAHGPAIMSHRDNASFKKSNIFYNTEFLWLDQWIPKTPKGYIVLYTSPLNRFDLPFRTLDAIIDSDYYFHEYQGNYPFYIEKGFSGLIPAGTPMYQIILIKRENWKGSQEKYNYEKNYARKHVLRKHLLNGYKKEFWQQKSFE